MAKCLFNRCCPSLLTKVSPRTTNYQDKAQTQKLEGSTKRNKKGLDLKKGMNRETSLKSSLSGMEKKQKGMNALMENFTRVQEQQADTMNVLVREGPDKFLRKTLITAATTNE